ncbi:MAG TPA: hypothetical protein VER08_07180 [Pyrinomonadaceae bacterium]|nr:hypothetical protein [Pyrinomonadaceae bacterium]
MRLFHLFFGVLLFVAFLLTGQYMDIYHNHLEGMADGPRLLMRSRHIYILLAALLNLGLGAYFTPRRAAWRRGMQYAGSALVAASSALLVAAFFYEPRWPAFYTPLSRLGLYTVLAGTLFHVFGGAARREVSADA